MPAGQTRHVTSVVAVPATDGAEPSGHCVHGVHCEEPATGAKPLTHDVHAVLPSDEALPAGQMLQTVSAVDVQAPVGVGA